MSHNLTPSIFGKVAVLFGGTSSEREVSLKSGSMVLKALKDAGVDAHAFDPAQKDLFDLKKEGFNRAFIALHGKMGEDGCLQGALEYLKIPYTGSNVMASSIAMDKWRTKMIWLQNGIPTPEYVLLTENSNWQEVIDTLGLPLIVKPATEGSSIGFSKITKQQGIAELKSAYELAAKKDALVLAERFIGGRELTCTVLGQGLNATALPLVEIKAPDGNYDFHNKYLGNETEYLCPAPLNQELTEKIQNLVVKSYQLLGCSGWGRADILLQENEPFLLEMNTAPGMTDHSLAPLSAKTAGMSYTELVLHLLSQAQLHQN
jgi:D-alanine-D-alanine ligase